MRIFEGEGQKLLATLGFSFVAFDLSRNPNAPVTDVSSGNVDPTSSSSASNTLFLSSELAVYNFFAPNPKDPIPVIVDDRARYPSLDPRYTAIGVKAPGDLFGAVAAMRRSAAN
jgi:hypothetical protein